MPSPVSSLHQPPVADVTNASPVDPVDASKEKKPTVLESHGYTLGKTIGNGSYATVRMAQSERHEGNVAIKIVSKFSAPADYLKKFLPREIEVVKGLRHPNLIRFLQAIETTHRVYIIMEYADNGSLLDIIRKDQLIDETRARKWFKQLVYAIDYCHDRGVVHRDVKCENLLMDEGWNVKLSDFGFARGHMKPKNGNPILSETYCGSYAYASPEILRGIPYQPQHADIWSMGVVLFAMVFGRLPFDDSDYKELIKQVSSKVVFPKDPKVSVNCKSLINKILSPLKSRIRISGIRIDSWFSYEEDQAAGSSKERRSSTESEDDRRSSLDPDTIVPPDIITKEQLESKARPRGSKRYSTDEEETVKTEDPTRSDTEDSSKGNTTGKQKRQSK
ncbi:testis-specific serine/threonine-protein kinase 3-like [Sitophilus oryzae]|uniref:Testis-specific serine/threonine-protein kinase 3-like n=1 Tax=Sitophilus oryzae TaxID=7048 RepID=A0A6J2YNI3_SITOR|nr:testis-specific serine/threonine-protein kinase 3-like [Sitophilus oryzae]